MSSAMVSTGTVEASTQSSQSPNPGVTPSPAAGPVLLNETIEMAVSGLDPRTAPRIKVIVTANSNNEPAKVDFEVEGTRHPKFKPDGSSEYYMRGDRAIFSLENLDSQGGLNQETVVGAIKNFKQAQALLAQPLNREQNIAAAERLIQEAFNALDRKGPLGLPSDGNLIAGPTRLYTDPRLSAVMDELQVRLDLELVDTRMLDTARDILPRLALGKEKLTVRTKGPGVEGNVYEATFETHVGGVDVTQKTNPDFVKPGKPQQVLAARLEKTGTFNPGDVNCVVNETIALAELLQYNPPARDSILPGEISDQKSKSILGSNEGFQCARDGAITHAANVVIAGHGHIHEKVDYRGALLENITLADGVFQLEGKLLKGSKITVKAGATLMLDLVQGSDVELVIEPGAKVMSGPAKLGVSGSRVSGKIQGDLSQLDLKNVEWGTNPKGDQMTWKDFKGMIYDSKRCDMRSINLFVKQSSAYSDVAGLLEVDRKNLSITEMHELLAEKFPVHDKPFGFVVEGKEPNRGTFFRPITAPDGSTHVQVSPVMFPPGHKVSDLEETFLADELADPKRAPIFIKAHDALLEILSQRNGGYGVGSSEESSIQQVKDDGEDARGRSRPSTNSDPIGEDPDAAARRGAY